MNSSAFINEESDSDSFIVLNIEDVDLEAKYRKLKMENEILEKRHNDLLKLIGELLKLPKNNSLEDIHQHVFQIFYNEIRRHSLVPFSSVLGNYSRRLISENLPSTNEHLE